MLALPTFMRPVRSLLALAAGLAVVACEAGELDTPTSPDPVTAAAKGGNGKGGGPGGGGGDGGDGGDPGFPTVEPVEFTAIPGNAVLHYAAGDYAVGIIDGGCAFVLPLSSGQLECLDDLIPDAARVYATGVNRSGRVVGTHYLEAERSETGFYPIEHAFVIESSTRTFTEIAPPPPYHEAWVECCTSERSVASDGRVLVEFRSSATGSNLDATATVALVGSDLQSTALPLGELDMNLRAVGLSDEGWSILRNPDTGGFLFWSGEDGATPTPFAGSDGGKRGSRTIVLGVTDDNRIYGLRDGQPILWTDPSSEPVLLADLTVTDFMVHTDDGHLVALQRGQKRNDPDAIYCFSLAGVTRLALPAGYNGGQGWTGANGRVYGVGYQEQADGSTLRTPLVWDVSGAGGC